MMLPRLAENYARERLDKLDRGLNVEVNLSWFDGWFERWEGYNTSFFRERVESYRSGLRQKTPDSLQYEPVANGSGSH